MERAIETIETKTPREAAVIRALKRAYNERMYDRLSGMHSDTGDVSAWYGEIAIGYRVEIERQTTHRTCRASEAQMLCKHVAALADKTGLLDCLMPDFYTRAFGLGPVDPAPAVTPAELISCPDCHGDGYTRMYTGSRMSDWISFDCHRCEKTGQVLTEERDLVAA